MHPPHPLAPPRPQSPARWEAGRLCGTFAPGVPRIPRGLYWASTDVRAVEEARVPILIRDMRPEDRDAVLALTQHTWSWGDYLPESLDEWLADPESLVRVAVTDTGRVVAVQHYQRLDTKQCWLSGLRVDPEYRGQGIAGLLLEDAIAIAHTQGESTLRYATEVVNDAIHQLSQEHHLRPRGTWLSFERRMDAAACRLGRGRRALGQTTTVLGPGDRLRALSLLHANGRTLYAARWVWRDLDNEALGRLIEQKGVLFSRSGVGGWSLALISHRTDTKLEATLYGTDAVCTHSLLGHIKREACESRMGVEIVIHVPQDASAAGILAGLAARGEWHSVMEHPLRIWELDLTAPE